MDLHYLKLFNTLAAELSYSKAAAVLFISQPALSMQIKKLEKDLGLKLFEKVGRNVYLSSEGKQLYEYSQKIFALVNEAETRLSLRSGEVKGTVNIGASNTPGSYILPRILGEFREKYPMTNTNLHIGNTTEIERLIFENKIDFAINGGDILYSKQIHVEKLSEDEAVFVASPDSSLSSISVLKPENLVNAKFIAHEKDSQLHKLFENILTQLGLPINITMNLGSIDAIKQAVAADLGISLIPRSAMKFELKYKMLQELSITGRKWKYPYNLIYHINKRHQPITKVLIDLIRLNMKDMSYQK